ncbi:hypothetical protein Vafri_417 [Volvox africanus]|nr:hypothetical protein Vafri_417 [Volvox africanus]
MQLLACCFHNYVSKTRPNTGAQLACSNPGLPNDVPTTTKNQPVATSQQASAQQASCVDLLRALQSELGALTGEVLYGREAALTTKVQELLGPSALVRLYGLCPEDEGDPQVVHLVQLAASAGPDITSEQPSWHLDGLPGRSFSLSATAAADKAPATSTGNAPVSRYSGQYLPQSPLSIGAAAASPVASNEVSSQIAMSGLLLEQALGSKMPAIFQWDCAERSCVLTVAGQQIKPPPHAPLPVDCTNDLLMVAAMHQMNQLPYNGKTSDSENDRPLLAYAALPLMSGPRIIGALWLGVRGAREALSSSVYSNMLESLTAQGSIISDSSSRYHHHCANCGTNCPNCQNNEQQQKSRQKQLQHHYQQQQTDQIQQLSIARSLKLLGDVQALEQLALSASLAVLAATGSAEYVHWLAGSIRRLATCSSLPTLVAGVCATVAQHVLLRFHADVAVQPALVPEHVDMQQLAFMLLPADATRLPPRILSSNTGGMLDPNSWMANTGHHVVEADAIAAVADARGEGGEGSYQHPKSSANLRNSAVGGAISRQQRVFRVPTHMQPLKKSNAAFSTNGKGGSYKSHLESTGNAAATAAAAIMTTNPTSTTAVTAPTMSIATATARATTLKRSITANIITGTSVATTLCTPVAATAAPGILRPRGSTGGAASAELLHGESTLTVGSLSQNDRRYPAGEMATTCSNISGGGSRGVGDGGSNPPSNCRPQPTLAANSSVACMSAKAFQLSHTLLQRLLVARSSCPATVAANAAPIVPATAAVAAFSSRSTINRPPPPSLQSLAKSPSSLPTPLLPTGIIVVDTVRHVADGRQPSRDICMLMGAGNARPVSSVTGATAAGTWQHQQQRGSGTEYIMGAANFSTGAIVTGTAAAGFGSTLDLQQLPGGGNRCNSPSSLVLLAMEVAKRGCILALYLSFPTCMPLPLLAAVRESCEQLLGKTLVGLIRHKMKTPDIAPDLETLRAGVPGLYVSTSTVSRQGDDEIQIDEQQLQILAANSGDRLASQILPPAAGPSLPTSGSISSHWVSTGRSGPSPFTTVRAVADVSRIFPVNNGGGGPTVTVAVQSSCQQRMLSSCLSQGGDSSMSPPDGGSFNSRVQCSCGIKPVTGNKCGLGLTATEIWDDTQQVIEAMAPAAPSEAAPSEAAAAGVGMQKKTPAAGGGGGGGISTLAIPAASKVIQALRSAGASSSGNKRAAVSRGVLLFGSNGGGRALPLSRAFSTGQQAVVAAPSAAAGTAAALAAATAPAGRAAPATAGGNSSNSPHTIAIPKCILASGASTSPVAAPAAAAGGSFRLMIDPDTNNGKVKAPVIPKHSSNTNGIIQTRHHIYRPQQAAEFYGSSAYGVEGELSMQCRYAQQQQLMTSMMSVEGVDEAWGMRGIMGTMVEVLMATLRTGTQGPALESESGDDLMCDRAAEGLEDLHLADVLGFGANGLVLRGTLGTVPVAVKLVEMVDADCPTEEKGGSNKAHQLQTQFPGARRTESSQIRARRIMLRNATELALTRVMNHVCIVQSFAIYDNVVMEKAAHVVGGITLRRLDAANRDTGGSPICTAIVQELCDKGTLSDVLEARTFPMTVMVGAASPPYIMTGLTEAGGGCGGDGATEAAPIAGGSRMAIDLKGVYLTLLEIALALRHLHSRRLVHRDLKPANILLKSNPSDPRGWSCKLADFGFALMLDRFDQRQDDEDLMTTNFSVNGLNNIRDSPGAAAGADGKSCTNNGSNRVWYAVQSHAGGTVTHMAPEAMVANARIDSSVDIYSLGIIFWELLCGRGRRPYLHLDLQAIPTAVAAGTRPVFSSGVPEEYRKMAEACWAHEPHRRPRAADIVSFIKAQLYQRRG